MRIEDSKLLKEFTKMTDDAWKKVGMKEMVETSLIE